MHVSTPDSETPTPKCLTTRWRLEVGNRRLGVSVLLLLVIAAVTASAQGKKTYSAPRTPWGDPDLQGAYTNSSESLTPMERPDTLTGKRLEDFTPEELDHLAAQRNDARAEADRQRWELRSPIHWFENLDVKGSRAWLVIDPPDGKIPAQTAAARKRLAAVAESRRRRGEYDSWEDRSLYDRCITRGIPGSMMPAIYGNAYDITQGPGVVVIRYEMVHEARVIPLDSKPHIDDAIRSYMGDARGHFEGETLVVETTNFNEQVSYRGSSTNLRLIERFMPVAADVVVWSVTFDDQSTWSRPWTFAMNLTRVPAKEGPFEYACHEGNYAMRNLLSSARAAERADGK